PADIEPVLHLLVRELIPGDQVFFFRVEDRRLGVQRHAGHAADLDVDIVGQFDVGGAGGVIQVGELDDLHVRPAFFHFQGELAREGGDDSGGRALGAALLVPEFGAIGAVAGDFVVVGADGDGVADQADVDGFIAVEAL